MTQTFTTAAATAGSQAEPLFMFIVPVQDR